MIEDLKDISQAKNRELYVEYDTKLFGVLQEINLQGKDKFSICDMLDNKVNCIIDGSTTDRVKGLIGKHVDIIGKAYYRKDSHIPIKVEVNFIEEHQESGENIKLEDLYGLDRDFRKDDSAVKLIREVRDKE